VKKLLAKSIRVDSNENDKYALTLIGHLELGIIAAQQFRDIASIICEKLDLTLTPAELIQTVILAIWLHDWGKANEDFQAMLHRKSPPELLRNWYGINEKVTSSRSEKHLIRHELLSVIFATRISSVYQWLKSVPNPQFWYAILAVLGHHLKVKDYSYFNNVGYECLKVYTDCDDFQEVLKLGYKYLGLSDKLPSFPKNFVADKLKFESCKLGGDTESLFVKLNKEWNGDLNKLKNTAVVKALVMSADLAASALLEDERGKHTYTDWIKNALAQVMTASEFEKIITQRLKGKNLLDFQKDAANRKSRVLIVIAGCGAGKSIVPFCVFKRLAEEEDLKAKVFFCYPTTATTSQA
jgi:CRISPR-associated endonuclease/helicase Cas3